MFVGVFMVFFGAHLDIPVIVWLGSFGFVYLDPGCLGAIISASELIRSALMGELVRPRKKSLVKL